MYQRLLCRQLQLFACRLLKGLAFQAASSLNLILDCAGLMDITMRTLARGVWSLETSFKCSVRRVELVARVLKAVMMECGTAMETLVGAFTKLELLIVEAFKPVLVSME